MGRGLLIPQAQTSYRSPDRSAKWPSTTARLGPGALGRAASMSRATRPALIPRCQRLQAWVPVTSLPSNRGAERVVRLPQLGTWDVDRSLSSSRLMPDVPRRYLRSSPETLIRRPDLVHKSHTASSLLHVPGVHGHVKILAGGQERRFGSGTQREPASTPRVGTGCCRRPPGRLSRTGARRVSPSSPPHRRPGLLVLLWAAEPIPSFHLTPDGLFEGVEGQVGPQGV